MDDEAADRFMSCFERFSPESIRNEYYSDLLTWLDDDIPERHSSSYGTMRACAWRVYTIKGLGGEST